MIVRLLYAAVTVGLLAIVPIHTVRVLKPEAEGPAHWPEFHGPERSNLSPETELRANWPEGGPPLVWKYTGCGIGYANVSASDGKLFTSGNVDDTEMVLALDLAGQPVWRSPSGPAWRPTHRSQGRPWNHVPSRL